MSDLSHRKVPRKTIFASLEYPVFINTLIKGLTAPF